MYTYTSIIKKSWFLVWAAGMLSCKKFIDISPSPDLIETQALFNSDATALAAISGVYVLMRETTPSLANGTLSIYSALSADELHASAAVLEFDAFEKNAVQATSDVVISQIWTPAYRVIYRTNIILENLDKSKGLSLVTKNQLTGEMKLVRALHYFYLVNLFDSVPLQTSSDYRDNESKPRNSVEEVYMQIVKDLTEAAEVLTNDYPGLGKVRPNKYAALALLSRVYLYQQEWAKSESMATQVIASGLYSLVHQLSGVFKKNSQETIWEIASPKESLNTTEGNYFIPSAPTDVPLFFLSPSILAAFETGDERKSQWTGINTVNNLDYFYPYKYKSLLNAAIAEYNIVFRLAEQYLIRAEARAQQNNIPGAITDLNIVRVRALLPPVALTDQIAVLGAILKERAVELFAEWGHRWLDLKRTGKINAVLSSLKGADWQDTDSLYPLPFDELQLNPFLVQNPGY